MAHNSARIPARDSARRPARRQADQGPPAGLPNRARRAGKDAPNRTGV